MRCESQTIAAGAKRTIRLGHLRTRSTDRPRQPISVGEFSPSHRLDLALDMIFDTAHGWLAIVNKEIRGARVAVERLADAPGIDHSQRAQFSHERLVNVSKDGQRLPERPVGRLERRVGCGCTDASPASGWHSPVRARRCAARPERRK